VAGAVKSLRVEHDPTRAMVLFDKYLRRYPDGSLAEEALALEIEAAAQQDDARAARLGREYLRRYPAGRFRTMAEEAQRRLR
jgi:TolA-binding protein